MDASFSLSGGVCPSGIVNMQTTPILAIASLIISCLELSCQNSGGHHLVLGQLFKGQVQLLLYYSHPASQSTILISCFHPKPSLHSLVEVSVTTRTETFCQSISMARTPEARECTFHVPPPPHTHPPTHNGNTWYMSWAPCALSLPMSLLVPTVHDMNAVSSPHDAATLLSFR